LAEIINSLGKKLRLRYQTDNALRTLAENCRERRNELALRDFASGRRWTFGELFSEGESYMAVRRKWFFPQGHSPEFIFNLLSAWRENKIACPLEAGQSPPEISRRQKIASTQIHFGHGRQSARFVAFTAEQLAADAENIVATMGLRADWPNLGVISLAHSYGFSNLILPLLLHGIPLILAPAPLPEIIRRAAENEKFITLAAVPAMWRAWHEADAIPPNVRLAISAGAPLPVNLEQEVFNSRGSKFTIFSVLPNAAASLTTPAKRRARTPRLPACRCKM
jgi:long-chain acyl-CoA synthetase